MARTIDLRINRPLRIAMNFMLSICLAFAKKAGTLASRFDWEPDKDFPALVRPAPQPGCGLNCTAL